MPLVFWLMTRYSQTFTCVPRRAVEGFSGRRRAASPADALLGAYGSVSDYLREVGTADDTIFALSGDLHDTFISRRALTLDATTPSSRMPASWRSSWRSWLVWGLLMMQEREEERVGTRDCHDGRRQLGTVVALTAIR